MSGIVYLLRIAMPSHTVRLSSAGFFTFNSEQYTAEDSLVGTLASVETMEEGAGDQVPAIDLTFNPPSALAIGTLTLAAYKRSPVRIWSADFNPDTGLLTGTPELEIAGFVDQPVISYDRGEYSIALSVVANAEWIFNRTDDNTLSPSFHKTLFPGETGHDAATGLANQVAWGTEAPRKSPSVGGGGFWDSWRGVSS